jgi:uncharacterized protein (DUF58 family)
VSTGFRFLPAHLADRLDGLALSLRRPMPGGQQGLHRSRHHGSSVEFSDYRAYAPGDPTHRIDWAVYARSDRYLLRRTEDETRLRAHILVDVSESMAFGRPGQPSKLHQACSVAAALAYVLVRQGDAAQLHPFTDVPRTGSAVAAGLDGLRPLLAHLEELIATGTGDAAAAMHAFADQSRPRGLVAVISDFLRPASEVASAAAHLHHAGHQVALIQVLDRDELALPFSGVVEIAELETGKRAVVEVDAMRAAYATAVREHLDGLAHGASAAGGSHHLIECGAEVDRALRSVLAGIA